jgi:hypothetical protein
MSDVTNRDDLQTLDAMGTFARREQQLLENVVAAATELVTWIVSQENETVQSFHFKALEGALKALSKFRQDDVTPSN